MMCKFKGVSAAILTFSLSVAIYFVFLNLEVDKSKPLVEPVEYYSLPFISLCDATRNPELYENANIRVRVYLSGRDNYGYYVSEPEKNCEAKTTFWLTEKSKAETEELLKQLTARYSNDSLTFAEVEVVGKLVDYKFETHYGRRFEIEAKEIKQISPVEQFTKSECFGKRDAERIKRRL